MFFKLTPNLNPPFSVQNLYTHNLKWLINSLVLHIRYYIQYYFIILHIFTAVIGVVTMVGDNQILNEGLKTAPYDLPGANIKSKHIFLDNCTIWIIWTSKKQVLHIFESSMMGTRKRKTVNPQGLVQLHSRKWRWNFLFVVNIMP